MHRTMSYRPEIDGLRALAVVSVVMFHAGVPFFAGGYTGVDIFFVISGYLITGIIYRQIRERSFSIAEFYNRRVRRIIPALIVMLISVMIFACLVDLPSELRNLPPNIAGALLFASNIVMWRHSGYFDAPAEMNPLLHTWSLGLEEQFYIVAPLILSLIMRYKPNYVRAALAVATLASLALCILATPIKPHASFYLVPTRAWELLSGALVATGCIRVPAHRGVREILTWSGLAMLAASVIFFLPSMSFPGFIALLPVLGATLVIGAAERTSAALMLSSKPFVAIGLISYSLYLWHWPIIVFEKQLGLSEGKWWSAITTVILSLGVAWLSWRFVERPFRGSRISNSKAFMLAGASVGVMLAAVVGLQASDGWPSRLSDRVVAFDAASDDISPMRDTCHHDSGLPDVALSCVFGGKRASMAVWGDSHGVELSYALGTEYSPVMSITYSSCPPALGYETGTRPQCKRHNQQVFDYLVASREIKTVVLTAYFRDAMRSSFFDEQFAETIQRLRDAGKDVIIIGPFPSPGIDVPKALAHGHPSVFPRADYEKRYAKVNAFLRRLEGRGVQVIWPARFNCNRTDCRIAENGHPLFFDRHHPSMTGARLFVRSVLNDERSRQILAQGE